VRASVGPRAARLHVGSGRTGFSTGAGPVGFYTSVGGSRRNSRGGGTSAHAAYQRQLAAQQRHATQQEKAQRAQELLAPFQRILVMHQAQFPPAERPIAEEPIPPDRAAIYAHFESQALTGIGRFQRSERKAAKQRATAWTDTEVTRQWELLLGEQREYQAELDRQWGLLCGNDPDMVLTALAEAFEDNESPSAAVNVADGEVSLVVMVPPAARVIPEQMPATTTAGNLSIRKVTASQRSDFYTIFVCAQVLVTVREAFAVAPALTSARIVVLRDDGRDPYGKPVLACLMAARVPHEALAGIRWADSDAPAILNAIATEQLLTQKGRAKELHPIDLSSEPDLAALVYAVDLDSMVEDA
jgi:hypothetical protein